MAVRTPRKPKSAAAILAGTLNAYHLAKKAEAYSVFPEWTNLVGKEIADIAYPEKILRRRVLVVRVPDSVFAQDLSLRKDEILEKLASQKTGMMFEDIRFVTGDPRRTGRKSEER